MGYLVQGIVFCVAVVAGVQVLAGTGYGRGSGGGYGEQRYVLRFHGQQFRARNTLFLRRELSRQHGVQSQGLDLLRVRLVAKSKHGRGGGSLSVGPHTTHEKRIYGAPYEFHQEAPRSYDRIDFHPPGRSSQGRWQIHLRGNIRVKKVVLVVRHDFVRPPERPFPRPSLPRTPRGRDLSVINCSSWDQRSAHCPVRGRIQHVTLLNQESSWKSPCVQGSTWGYTRDVVWVSQGCRANFQVVSR